MVLGCVWSLHSSFSERGQGKPYKVPLCTLFFFPVDGQESQSVCCKRKEIHIVLPDGSLIQEKKEVRVGRNVAVP